MPDNEFFSSSILVFGDNGANHVSVCHFLDVFAKPNEGFAKLYSPFANPSFLFAKQSAAFAKF